MKDNKGFTLIEILAVIVIMGIIMLIAIPAISKNVSDSRKAEFAESSIKLIEAARIAITAKEYNASNPEYTYYIPTKCLDAENGNTTSYGDLVKSYVVVTYQDDKYEYYYTGYTESGAAIKLTHSSLINEESIKFDTNSIRTDVGIGSRTKIYTYSDACTGSRVQSTAGTTIAEGSYLN